MTVKRSLAQRDDGVESVSPTLFHVTIAVTGGAVMVVEIVGTRLLAPVFGASLFVWAALLAVTLSSLAVGYYVGGIAADRHPRQQLLSVATTAAAVVLATAVVLGRSALSATVALGPRVGPLLSAFLLFSPCLVCLGTVSPIAVRLVTTEISMAGHRVGRIYALSTVAGLVSTLVASFVLIPRAETASILLWTAALLGLTGMLGLRGLSRAIAPAIVVAALWWSVSDQARTLPPGLRVLRRTSSAYGLIEVIEDANRGVQLLRADHSIIGGTLIDDHRFGVFGYVHFLEAVRFARPAAKTVLQIGLGPGTVPRTMERHGMVSDVVEIDPEVVNAARATFDFSTAGNVYIEDARTFINNSHRKYDLIVHDTFTGGTAPSHLFSLEVVQQLKKLLNADGIVAINFVGFQRGPDAEATWAIHRTLREVFSHVRLFSDAQRDGEQNPLGNLIFFASAHEMSFSIPRNAQFESDDCRKWSTSMSEHEVVGSPPSGILLTDATNPLDRLQLAIADHHFEAMQKLLPPSVWLP